MIQRIQTIFLFLASASLGSFSFLAPSQIHLISGSLEESLAALLSVVAAMIGLGAIFLFNNRKVQKTMVYIALIIALIALVVLFIFFQWQLILALIPTWLIPVAIIFLLLGVRGINKDEKLIKSLDRLR